MYSIYHCLSVTVHLTIKTMAVSGLVVQYGGTALVQVKMLVSSFYGVVTFLAASCCLDAIRGFSGAAKMDDVARGGWEGLGAAGVGNGGDRSDLRKESFIANLVANMTVPELGKKYSP
jgi:hypothetical protein